MCPEVSPPSAAPVCVHEPGHVAVADSGAGEGDAFLPQGGFEPEVRHHRADDAARRELALRLPVAGHDPQHVVAVEDPARLVGEDRPVGVPVEGDAEGGALLARHRRHALGMEGAATAIDVAPVGGVVDRGDVRPRAVEGLRADLERRSVARVEDDRQPVEVPRRAGLQARDVSRDEARVRVRRRGRRRGHSGAHPLDQLLLEVFLAGVGPLAAVRAEDLDAVVLVRIVRGRDRHARGGADLEHELGDSRCGDHAGRGHAAARLAQPGGEVGDDRGGRLAGVAADDDARRSRSGEPAAQLAAEQPHRSRIERIRTRPAPKSVGPEELQRAPPGRLVIFASDGPSARVSARAPRGSGRGP